MNWGLSGELAIWLILATVILSGGAFFITALGKRNLFNLGARAYYLQIALTTLALIDLWYLFFSHDFSISYIYSYSSSDLSFFYLLSALWAGQEGTYLLWLFFCGLFGLAILYGGKRYKSWGMFFHSLVNLFLGVMLLTVSPFKPLDFPAIEGAGLNPLLQDPWMVVHPPLMFVAYAMAGLPFAIAMAAMIRKDYSEWLKVSFPYVQMTALLLAIANVLGGFWAYKTLGWGGYWAWDPVENTSFIPWVVSLGLVHGMLIEKRSGALRRSNILLAAFVFVLVIYGTFLTRSGVLADFSVHSFVDLGANAVLVTFLLFYLIISLGIFLYSKGGDIVGRPLNYNIYSRDFILYIGLVLLFVFGIVVLFWSSLPFLTTHMTSTPAAAEIKTYNAFAFPLTILLCLFLTLAPFLKGSGESLEKIKSRSLIALAISILIIIPIYIFSSIDFVMALTLLLYLFVILIFIRNSQIRKQLIISLVVGLLGMVVALLLNVRSLDSLMFIGAASAAGASAMINLRQYFPGRIKSMGGPLCHAGFAIMVIGILASSAFSINETVVLPRGERKSALGYGLTYQGMTGSPADANNSLIVMLDDRGTQIETRPQFFYSRRQDGYMKKPHIRRHILFDIYLSPQDIQEASEGSSLTIKKGETKTIDDLTVYFDGFEMTSHSADQSITVGVKLNVAYDGENETIIPSLTSDFATGSGVNSTPIRLSGRPDYEFAIERVFADEGAVALSVSGPGETSRDEKLVLDVSKKPGINLLWVGTIVIFIGMIFSVYRRLKT